MTGLTVAIGLLGVWQSSLPWVLLLGVPPCWMFVKHYRAHEVTARAHDLERRLSEAA